MAGILTEDHGPEGRYVSSEGLPNQSGDSLAEWRSSEQVENGVPSTSPPFWDTDDEDDCGPKPSELFGRFTWKIDNYSQINKRELRSNVFEVGGYKWYILIYPQGCDVCNHLSLFLCVANHDKLLPGWSHFAQFTIAVVNKEPKKSKYSDTLHRFWKKEHDWGWKKFMELTKVSDGFVVNDTLVIKAQVQVIREKANCLFRCLDRQYRRELVRVYLSNVEQICRRFVEERRSKMCKLIEDRSRWSSFRDFWLGIDHSSRRRMSSDKSEAILKIVVKHFFIEKEVTSTLVMDSLYSGLKALECQSLNKKGKAKAVELEEFPKPMVLVEKDMFVLADDVLTLLERMASEPVPHQPLPPKDDKGLQNRTKDGSSGDDFNKDTIEREERRLTELGRRTVEVYVLTHIFSSSIEVAYQEAIALKRQEELIREEEAAAGQAENEFKTKRGGAEKEKRTKKKQAKQKRSSRKVKDKGRDEKSEGLIQDTHILESASIVRILEDLPPKQAETILENDRLEGVSDVSDVGEDVLPVLQPDLDERDGNTTNGDTDTSEIQGPMEASNCVGRIEKRNPVVMDDSSSTCSSDSVPSVVIDGTNRANPLPNKRSQTSPNRGKSQQGKDMHENTTTIGSGNKLPCNPSNNSGHSKDIHGCSYHPELDSVLSLKDQICQLEKETIVTFHKRLDPKDQVDVERLLDSRSADASSSSGLGRKLSVQQQKLASENTTSTVEPILGGDFTLTTPHATEKSATSAARAPQSFPIPKSESLKLPTSSKSSTVNQVTAASRPGSVPPNPPGPRPSAISFSAIQTAPMLSRSVSAAGRLGADQSPAPSNYYPQSYRNAIMGRTSISASTSGLPHPAVSSSGQAVGATSQPSTAFLSVSTALQPYITKEQTAGRPGIAFGSGKPEAALPIQPPRRDESSSQEASRGSRGMFYDPSGIFELQKKQYTGGASVSAVSSSRHTHGLQDDFPHLDIINDLLDDEQSIGRVGNGRGHQHQHQHQHQRQHQHQHQHHPHHQPFSRQYSFPGNVSSMEMGLPDRPSLFDHHEEYYDDSYSRFYGSVGGSLSELTDAALQQQVGMYSNAHVDGLIQNQWPYNRGPDFSRLNLDSTDTEGYAYQLQHYMNSARGMNGFPPYRPPNPNGR